MESYFPSLPIFSERYSATFSLARSMKSSMRRFVAIRSLRCTAMGLPLSSSSICTSGVSKAMAPACSRRMRSFPASVFKEFTLLFIEHFLRVLVCKALVGVHHCLAVPCFNDIRLLIKHKHGRHGKPVLVGVQGTEVG